MVSVTIKSIRSRYQKIEQQVRDSKIPHVVVNTDSLIRAACKKNGVQGKVIRQIAGWNDLKAGGGTTSMKIIKNEDD